MIECNCQFEIYHTSHSHHPYNCLIFKGPKKSCRVKNTWIRFVIRFFEKQACNSISFKHIWHLDKLIWYAFQLKFLGFNFNFRWFLLMIILYFLFSIGHYKCTDQEASVWIIVSIMCLFVRRLQSSFRSFGTLQKLPIREIPFQTYRWRVERSQEVWISDSFACLCQLPHYLNATIKGRMSTFIGSN